MAPGSTVADLMDAMGINDRRGVAVAVEGEVVPAALWRDAILLRGQKVEILRAVQGGAD